MQVCPGKGNFLVATYDAPWKVFGRHNEILWVKRPHHKHGHHSNSLVDEQSFSTASLGLQALDVENLFPEEFPDVDEDFDESGGFVGSAADTETNDQTLMLQDYFTTSVQAFTDTAAQTE